MGMETMFSKYKKKNDYTKVLMIYLLLGGYDIKKIVRLEEVEENRMFGLKIHKVYGITEDFVNVTRIVKEIEQIVNPVICSPQSYEYYSDSPEIHTYTPKDASKPLWVNDISIISKNMIITKNCIVSNNFCKPLTALSAEKKGFMFFMDYVLNCECVVGDRWYMSYKDKVFNIYYLSKDNEDADDSTVHKILLYSAIEIDKSSTYKWVIYIIQKSAPLISEWQSDNYVEQAYEMVVD